MNLEDELSETFHERTVRTDYPRTSMDTIVGRAHAVRRRRRRTTAIVAAAAAAAFAIPAAGLWAQHAHRSVPEPASSPWRGIEEGPAPGVDYLRGSEYHQAGSAVVRLPLSTVTAATVYRRGWLVAYTTAQQERRLSWLDDQLRIGWTTCAGPGPSIVRSADGIRVAYATVGCRDGVTTLHLGPAEALMGDEQTARLRGQHDVRLAGIVGDGVVYSHPSADGNGRTVVTDLQGNDRRLRGLGAAVSTDPSGRLVAGRRGWQGTAVVDQRSGATLWRTPEACCAFSFDGSYALTLEPTGPSGLVARELRVLDTADGRQRTTITLPRGLYVEAVTWDLDDTVLVSVSDVDPGAPPAAGDRVRAIHQAILRFDLSGGAPTLAAPMVRVDQEADGYAFPAPGT